MIRRVAMLLALGIVLSAGGCPESDRKPGEAKCVNESGQEVSCPTKWTMGNR